MCGINERIHEARIKSGLTLTQVSEKLEQHNLPICPSMLSALERGERRLAAETVLALS